MAWFVVPVGRTIVDAHGNCTPMPASFQAVGVQCVTCHFAALATSEDAARDALDSHRAFRHGATRPRVKGE